MRGLLYIGTPLAWVFRKANYVINELILFLDVMFLLTTKEVRMSAPVTPVIISLWADLIGCINKYKSALLNAPQKSSYVFGSRTDTKNDAKYAFTTELKGLAELAVICRDKKTLDAIKMVASPEADQSAADVQAIGNMEILE